MDRTFVLTEPAETGLKARGKSPVSAARKLATKLMKKSGEHKVLVKVVDQAKEGGKTYAYEASRVKTDKTVVRNGKSITYEFEMKIKSVEK